MPDSEKLLIEYTFVPSGEHLQLETKWSGRHPQQAIDHAKAVLELYARSQYDEIKIYSKKYLGRVYFHVSGMQQMIDWQPAKAPLGILTEARSAREVSILQPGGAYLFENRPATVPARSAGAFLAHPTRFERRTLAFGALLLPPPQPHRDIAHGRPIG
jgi:hypothetical protein